MNLRDAANVITLPDHAVRDGILLYSTVLVTVWPATYPVTTRYVDNHQAALDCILSYTLEGKPFAVTFEV